MHLADSAGHGQRRCVRQPALEGTPDPLDRVVVGTVARPVQHPHLRVCGQPGAHQLGVVDDHIVADHRHDRRAWVGRGKLLQERDEGGDDRLAGDLVEPPAGQQVDRAEDAAPLVFSRRHHLLAGPAGDPGGPQEGQQVEVDLVFCQHHRSLGQPADRLADGGDGLLGVRIALGDQARPPPGCDLAGAPVQSPQGHGGTAEPLPQPRDRPGAWLIQQPQDALAEGGATQPGPTRPGPVGQAHDPFKVVAMHPAADGEWVVAEQAGDGSR